MYKVNARNWNIIDRTTRQIRPQDLNATPQDCSISAAVFASLYTDDPNLEQNH